MSKASRQASEIDRLIDLASDERNPSRPSAAVAVNALSDSNGSLSLEEHKGEEHKGSRLSMWGAVSQLRVVLPHLVRLLPLLERGFFGTNLLGGLSNPAPATVDTSHFDRGIAEIEGAHRDLSLVVKNQTGEIKFLQEQVSWLSKSIEKDAERREELAHKLAALKKTVTIWAVILGVLLVGLTAAVVFLAFQRPA
jgi:hypothetical protein